MKQHFGLIRQAIMRQGVPAQVPIYEHGVDLPIISDIMGYSFDGLDFGNPDDVVVFWGKLIAFYSQMGYPALTCEMGIRFPHKHYVMSERDDLPDRVKRGWVNEHAGPIQNWDDLRNEEYWPDIDHAFDYETFGRVCALVPDHMKIIGGASGGPFEHASFLMGLENLCMMIYDDPAFIDVLFEKIGHIVCGVAERLVVLDKVGIYRFGDDLGYKSATMLHPDVLRRHVFPWYRKTAEAAHAAGKPFLLHSCGRLDEVMEDIIACGVDGKHSFEDVIMPVAEAKKKWGDRIAIFGGVDVDFLARSTPAEVRERTKRILEACAPSGGYAAGSGNTITSYVPVANYLAMMEAIGDYNGTTGCISWSSENTNP